MWGVAHLVWQMRNKRRDGTSYTSSSQPVGHIPTEATQPARTLTVEKNQTRLPLLPSVTLLLFASLMCNDLCGVFFSTGNQGGLSKYNKKEKRQRGEPWKTARLRANELRHFPVTWPLDLLIKRVSQSYSIFTFIDKSSVYRETAVCTLHWVRLHCYVVPLQAALRMQPWIRSSTAISAGINKVTASWH